MFTGSVMEVNISHRCRQEILTTPNLSHPHLFDNALNELLRLMKMVCTLLPFCVLSGRAVHDHFLGPEFLSLYYSSSFDKIFYGLWRIWREIIGHRCSSWSSKRKQSRERMVMSWSKCQVGISPRDLVPSMALTTPFTTIISQRALTATSTTHVPAEFGDDLINECQLWFCHQLEAVSIAKTWPGY